MSAVMQGLMAPLLATLLAHRGASSALVGLNAATTPLGMVLAAPATPSLTRRLGARGLGMISLCGASVGFAATGVTEDARWWLPLRLLTGLFFGTMFALTETWVNQLSPEQARGRVIGLYSTVLAVGFALGPLALAVIGNQGPTPFIVGCACPLAACALLAAVWSRLPRIEIGEGASVRRFFTVAPGLLLCVCVAAFAEQASLSLLPLFASRQGLTGSITDLALAAMIAGSIILLYPIGALADRRGSRQLIFACGVVSAVCCALLDVTAHVAVLFLLDVFVWGGVYYAIYTLSLVRLGSEWKHDILLAGNAAFGGVWGLGGLLGAPAVGAAMSWIGVSGFSLVLTAVFIGFLVALLRMGGLHDIRTRSGRRSADSAQPRGDLRRFDKVRSHLE